VHGVSGAATLHIPIAVPPGPGGLAPELALVYSSQAGNGPYGVGWSLPLGEVRCSARFGVPDYASCEDYELDGALLVKGAGNRYHTLVESFQRILKGPAGGAVGSWEVTTSDGTRLRYGIDSNGRIHAETSIARWLLQQIEDVHGNRIDIAYELDEVAEPGTAYPSVITYAGGFRVVEFFYEGRPDELHDYRDGIERYVTRRLREIQVTSGGSIFQRRLFGYADPAEYTTVRSRLAWTQVFGTDCDDSDPVASCTGLPREEYDYTDSTAGHVEQPPGSPWELPVPLYLPPDAGVDQNVSDPGVRFADVNGDGLTDIVHAYCTEGPWPCANGEGNRQVYLNTGSGWDTTSDEAVAWTASLKSLTYEQPSVNVRLDSHDRGACGYNWVDTVSRGVVFSEWPYYFNAVESAGQARNTYRPLLSWQIVDLNGDGLPDLVTSEAFGGIARRDSYCGIDPAPGEAFLPVPNGGGEVRAAFRNTGSGWERDDSLAEGLPLFSSIMIDSRNGSGLDCRDGSIGTMGGYEYGFWADGPVTPGLPCMARLRFHPVFVELDGDPEPELVALERENPELPWMHPDQESFHYYAPSSENEYESVAWDYRETGGEPGWEWQRAQEFDLPYEHIYTAFGAWDPYDHLGGGQTDTDNGARFADLNRDGLVDFIGYLNRGAGVAKGSAWVADSRYVPPGGWDSTGYGYTWHDLGWCTEGGEASYYWACTYDPRDPWQRLSAASVWLAKSTIEYVGDLNGDGWVDLQMGGSVWLNSGAAIGDSAWLPVPGYGLGGGVESWCAEGRALTQKEYADVNGDGIADALYTWSPTPGVPCTEPEPPVDLYFPVFLSQSGFPDLIQQHRNGRGGIREFAYTGAPAQQDELLEQDAETHASSAGIGEGDGVGSDVQRYARVPVVSEVTLKGEHVATETTQYRYARPRFDPELREALGFRLVETRHPDGSSVDTYYYQHVGRSGELSRQEVFDEHNGLISTRTESWNLVPDPGSVTGSISGVRLGRLVQRSGASFYDGTLVPSMNTALIYDDAHGYNFVSMVVQSRPTGVLFTSRTPKVADTDSWLVNLVAEEIRSDSLVTLSHEVYTHTAEGLVGTVTRAVQPRGGAGPPDTATTTRTYDGYGNVTSQTDTRGGGEPDRVVAFCYDGDDSWCPSFPEMSSSHSVLVGVRDPVGGVVGLEREWASGVLVRRERTNEFGKLRDQLRYALDAFGRTIETWYKGPEQMMAEVQVWSRVYQDAPVGSTPAFVESTAYLDDSTAPDAVASATYVDGFGRTLRTVEEVPGGWRGVAVKRDPTTRTTRHTYPMACVDGVGDPDPDCNDLTGSEDPAVVQERDALGRVVRTTSPDGEALQEHLAVAWTQPAGSGMGTVFGAVRLTDANGHVSQRLLDGDRVVRVDECHDPACASADRTFYTYEASGEVATIYDAIAVSSGVFDDASHYMRYHYDTLGRIIQTDDPDGGTTYAAYDHLGNATRATNARGQITTFAYDALDRVETIDRPVGVGEWDLTFTYDPITRRRKDVTTPQSSYRDLWRYDDFGRVKQQQRTYSGTTLVMDFEYDLAGRPTKIDYPNEGSGVTYGYDGAYLKKVCRGDDFCTSAPERLWISDVVYDDLGRRSQTLTRDGALTREYYALGDATAGRAVGGLKRLALTAGDAEGALDFSYRYDPGGNITQISDDSTQGVDASAAYTYDARNRLASWTDPDAVAKHYRYDALGNLLGHGLASPGSPPNQTYDAEKPHRIVQNRNGETYAYDADGNVTRRGAEHLFYDSANRLVCAGNAEGDCSWGEYRYDADGALLYESAYPRILMGELFDWRPATRLAISNLFAFGEKIGYERKSRATLRSASSPIVWPLPPTTTSLVWSLVALAVLLLLVRLGAGEALREHPAQATLVLALTALLVAPPPAWSRRRGGDGTAVRLFFRDHQGSLALVTDPTGTGQWRHSYEPFGKPILAGTGWTEFTGKRLHTPANLYNFGARWYDAEAGRFVSVDPVVGDKSDPQSHNAYSYVHNDPINLVDPTGMCARICTTYGFVRIKITGGKTWYGYRGGKPVDRYTGLPVDTGSASSGSGATWGQSGGIEVITITARRGSGAYAYSSSSRYRSAGLGGIRRAASQGGGSPDGPWDPDFLAGVDRAISQGTAQSGRGSYAAETIGVPLLDDGDGRFSTREANPLWVIGNDPVGGGDGGFAGSKGKTAPRNLAAIIVIVAPSLDNSSITNFRESVGGNAGYYGENAAAVGVPYFVVGNPNAAGARPVFLFQGYNISRFR
jgi:RHS repeat-associated protein